MVRVLLGDLFSSKAQTLVNTVNCVGVMGKGIALEFKNRFPDMYKDYLERCKKKEIQLGRPYLYKTLLTPWVLNFPTKDHWRSVSRLEDIVRGLEYLIQHYKEWGLESLAVPPLGCGHGQLEWRVVGPTLYRYLSQLDIDVDLYAPYGTPHEELESEFLNANSNKQSFSVSLSKIKPSWVALVEILKRIEDQPYHWPVGRVMFQKIAYVATREGLPTGLHYQKSSYGPFAVELKRLIAKLDNNGLIKEQQLGRMFAVKVGPTFDDANKAFEAYISNWEPIIEKTADLFMRLNTNQAEIVATILFAADELAKGKDEQPSEKSVFDFVMRWKQKRHPPLEKHQVAYAIRSLAALRWLEVRASHDLPVLDEAAL